MIVYCDSIFTFLSLHTCFASAYQTSSESVNPRQSYDVISISQDGGHGVANLLPVGVSDETRLRMSKCISVSNFIEICHSTAELLLLPVSNLIIYVTYVDLWLFTPKLLAFNENPIWRRPPSWICSTVLLDHPRSRVGGPNKRCKFCVNRLTSFRDMWIFHFCRLCLKMPIPAHFGRGFGGLTP